MRIPANTDTPAPANEADFPPVAICFEEELISAVFAELLLSMEVDVRIVDLRMEAVSDARIITETQYLPYINSATHHRCLIVGGAPELLESRVCNLEQPLNVQNIERALSSFLRSDFDLSE